MVQEAIVEADAKESEGPIRGHEVPDTGVDASAPEV